MNVLAFDASGPSCSVAIIKNDRLRFEKTVDTGLNHSVTLLPMIDEGLKETKLQVKDCDLIATVIGPGSFTGVRIGVSTLQGLAAPWGIPCVGINALEAYQAGLTDEQKLICPIRDARAGQVYGACFEKGQRLMEDCIQKLDDYLAMLPETKEGYVFVGDGAPVFEAHLKDKLGDKAHFAPMHLNLLKAGAVGLLALKYQAHKVSGDKVLPLYLRASQAERERLRKAGLDA
jgi:tRNA threonylcarbamoyladenosine biosynthesis protein TsaB